MLALKRKAIWKESEKEVEKTKIYIESNTEPKRKITDIDDIKN